MLDDVVKGLLNDPVNIRLDRGGESADRTIAFLIASKIGGDLELPRPFFQVCAKSTDQADSFEFRGTKFPRKKADVAIDVFGNSSVCSRSPVIFCPR